MRIRWGPNIGFLFLLLSILFQGINLIAGNQAGIVKVKKKVSPMVIMTRPLIVTGIYKSETDSGQPIVIKTKKLLVKGTWEVKDYSFKGISITTRVLKVTGNN